ncbi:hypothetical protein [Bartonella bovis]|nr:hypothetical protein [Bartonella bovis]
MSQVLLDALMVLPPDGRIVCLSFWCGILGIYGGEIIGSGRY